MRSAGYGYSNACNSALLAGTSPSQVRQSATSRITGMRLWMGAQSALGSPVMIVKVRRSPGRARAPRGRQTPAYDQSFQSGLVPSFTLIQEGPSGLLGGANAIGNTLTTSNW
jgi:hypothetical protein